MALKTLLPFPSTYLCEAGFSALTATKTRLHSRLDVRNMLCLLLAHITPRYDHLVSGKQAQGSHWCVYISLGCIIHLMVGKCIPDRSPPQVVDALTPVLSSKKAVYSTVAHWHTILLCSPDAKCSSHHPPCHPSPALLCYLSQSFLCVSLTMTEAADGQSD